MPTTVIRGRYPPPKKRCANYQSLMKNILLFVAACALCVACSECRLQPDPPFVRDIVMPTEVFDAGDEVTVAAVGFMADDAIFVRHIDPSTQMQATLRAEITELTDNSISFIMPAGYAAGAVEVLLFRGGEPMVLGSIEVSDGSLPTEATLYGLGHNEAGKFVIYDIDTATGTVSEKVVCPRALDGAVTWPSTNRVFGTDRTDGKTVIAGYDFTMRRHLAADCGEEISDCIIGMFGSALLPLRMEDDMRIKLIAANPAVSRSLPPQKRYLTGLNIPDDVVAAEFADDRFVYLGKDMFLTKMSVATADGRKYTALATLRIPILWTLGKPADDEGDILLVSSPQYIVTVKGEQSTVREVAVSETTLQPTTGAALGDVAGKTISCAYDQATGGIFLLIEADGTKTLGEFTPADGSYKEICDVPSGIGQILSVK